MSLTADREGALVRENQSLREQLEVLGKADEKFRDNQKDLLRELMVERDTARGLNKQAVALLQEVYALVRDDSAAISFQTMSHYRSVLLREISARIKQAVGAQVMEPAEVQVRAGDGARVYVECFDAEGQIRQRKPLTIDQARELIKEVEESITEIVTREAAAAFDGPLGPR